MDGAMELAKWLLSDPNETLYQIVQGVDVRVIPEFFLGMKGANSEENAVLTDPALVAALSEVYAEDFRFLTAVMGNGRLAVEGASLLSMLSGAGAVRTAVAQAGKTAVKAADDVAVGAAKGGTGLVDDAARATGKFSEVSGGAKLYPDGSLRTPDGKFASVAGSPAPGTTAASNYADFLSRNGVNVVGKEVAVEGPLGLRRYDIVVRDASGNLQGIEIKTGTAGKTPYQDFTDKFVNQFGAQGTGRIAGETVKSSVTIYLP
jgi:hypothetical protein